MPDSIDRRGFLARAAVAGSSLGLAPGAVARAVARSSRTGPPIRGQVIRRGAPGFAQAAHVYNMRYDSVMPSLVARPVDGADVRTAVNWGVAHGVGQRGEPGETLGAVVLVHGVV